MGQINLQKVVSVKGLPGLFHLTNYNAKGYFLQPFEGGPTRFFSNEKGKILAIGNVDLKLKAGTINALHIFLKIKESKAPKLNATFEEVQDFFKELIPDLNVSVAPSHLEKIWKWYHLISLHFQTDDMVNEEDDGLTII